MLEEIELLRRHRLREGALVFDLGAHQGIVALVLAAAVGPRGRVIAVEASAHNSAIAALNCAENDAPNISVVAAAVGERSGTIDFGQGLNGRVAGYGGDWGRVSVRAVTVDELGHEFGFPDVVFVDVEGWEQHVLRGASETLRRRPDWFVEVHAGGTLEAAGSSVDGVLAFFPGEEFELVASSENRGFRPLDRSAPPQERFLLVALPRESRVGV
ncbi:MAG: FkbM family methyltransferase [Gaiellaceae bacterium]